jgi:hypothetical protein
MTIRPTDPRQPPGAGAGRAAGPSASRPPAKGPSPATPAEGAAPADQVELSEEARQLQEALGLDRPTVSQLSPDRMREVLQRIGSGHYDRAEVRDEVLRRLAADLSGGGDG